MDDHQQLVTDHVRFAERMAATFCKRFKIPIHAREEMRSAAFVGLCRAACKFDPARGASFETFCFGWIRGAMLDQVRRNMKELRFDDSAAAAYLEDRGVEVHRSWDAERGEPVIDLSQGRGEELETAVLAGDLRELVARLSEPNRASLRMRYLDDASCAEIGRRLGISKAQVSRNCSAAVEQIREW